MAAERLLRLLLAVALTIALVLGINSCHAAPSSQQVFSALSGAAEHDDISTLEEGVGHFSQWSKAIKREFIDDVAAGKANEWTIVMGNEGGDLDSMTAALTWSYHVSHKARSMHQGRVSMDDRENPDWDKSPTPAAKAIALLQTPKDALDLRPENRLALHNVQMSPGHRDLLTLDELPLPAEELAKKIRGIVLVDHPEPVSVWKPAKILSIFDHHKDHGVAPHAKPRIFEGTASCTTIVARQMLDELEKLDKEYHVPHETLELMLSAIALDSDGLKTATPEDVFVGRRLLKRSNWRGEKLLDVMDRLDNEMTAAKKDLANLDVRDLLRRDWKGDMVETNYSKVPSIHVGFASIPISLDQQIQRTLHETVQSWFDIERKWSDEIGADVTLSLHGYKVKKRKHKHGKKDEVENEEEDDEEDEDDGSVHAMKKMKIREIVLVVRETDRLDAKSADALFARLSRTIGDSPFLDAEPWHSTDKLKERQMVWVHHQRNGGRKLVRPIIEYDIRRWRGET